MLLKVKNTFDDYQYRTHVLSRKAYFPLKHDVKDSKPLSWFYFLGVYATPEHYLLWHHLGQKMKWKENVSYHMIIPPLRITPWGIKSPTKRHSHPSKSPKPKKRKPFWSTFFKTKGNIFESSKILQSCPFIIQHGFGYATIFQTMELKQY